MNKQHVARRLSAVLDHHVRVGLHRWIEDVRDGSGRIVNQIVHDEGEKFTDDNGRPVAATVISEAVAWCDANPAPPTPVYTTYARLRERMTVGEREAILTLRRTNWRIDDFITWAAGAGALIDLNSHGVADAKAALVAIGVFVQARADEVFRS